jgi:hypothetical protein
MGQRWIRFAEERVQSLLTHKAEQLGAAFSLDTEGRVWFDDEEWWRAGDPHILTLDDEFGPEWVAVYADEPVQRAERIRIPVGARHPVRRVARRVGHVTGTGQASVPGGLGARLTRRRI